MFAKGLKPRDIQAASGDLSKKFDAHINTQINDFLASKEYKASLTAAGIPDTKATRGFSRWVLMQRVGESWQFLIDIMRPGDKK